MTEAEEFLALLKSIAHAPPRPPEEVERVSKELEAIVQDDNTFLVQLMGSETPAQFKTHFDPAIPTNLSRVDFGEDDD